MRIVDFAHVPERYTGYVTASHEAEPGFRLGYLRDGHPEGPEFTWTDDGIEALWSRAPLLPWAESTFHGPRWRWHLDGRPAHDALFEHYLCLRQHDVLASGERQTIDRYAVPEPHHFWTARQSPVRDVAFWNDDGVVDYAPLWDPDPLQPLPRELLDPTRLRPEALVKALAPITRRAVFEVPPGARDRLARLEAATDAEPPDLDAWAVLTDAQAELGHPLGPVSQALIAVLAARDLDRALDLAVRLGPAEEWSCVVAQRAWVNGDASGVERAAATMGIRLPPTLQVAIAGLADRASLPPEGALRVLGNLGSGPTRPGFTVAFPPLSGDRRGLSTQWLGVVHADGRIRFGVTTQESGADPDYAGQPREPLFIERAPGPPSPDTGAVPLGVPERALARFRRFVPSGSIGLAIGRW
ncbi:MAG: hypothetical protein AAF602_00645 [Myxococcota bacterium]